MGRSLDYIFQLFITMLLLEFGDNCKYPNLNMKFDIRKIVERKLMSTISIELFTFRNLLKLDNLTLWRKSFSLKYSLSSVIIKHQRKTFCFVLLRKEKRCEIFFSQNQLLLLSLVVCSVWYFNQFLDFNREVLVLCKEYWPWDWCDMKVLH